MKAVRLPLEAFGTVDLLERLGSTGRGPRRNSLESAAGSGAAENQETRTTCIRALRQNQPRLRGYGFSFHVAVPLSHDSEPRICKKILKDGDVQVSDREREVHMEGLWKAPRPQEFRTSR